MSFPATLRKRQEPGASVEAAAQLQVILEESDVATIAKGTPALDRAVEQIARVFFVRQDEVAVLVLIAQGKILKFLVPEKLNSVGTSPMTCTKAWAARTARETRPDVINRFHPAPHGSGCEGVPLGRGHGEQIYRIMSAPIVSDGKVVGVLQVSRKGLSLENAGVAFSQEDLRKLVALSALLGPLVKDQQVL
ncbi:MAG: hypothetical protein PVS2B2_00480 [Candidatus Acidiferrum sp.]